MVTALKGQCEMGKRWLYPDMEELVMKELDATVREFRVDPARIYLTGFSMGATGAYRIAAKWPERFAALMAVAGRVEPASTYRRSLCRAGSSDQEPAYLDCAWGCG